MSGQPDSVTGGARVLPQVLSSGSSGGGVLVG